MRNTNDLYTHHIVVPLKNDTTALGTAIICYEVRRCRDLMNLTESLAYEILCTQRVIIPNASPYVSGAIAGTTGSDMGFSNYPAIVTNQMSIVPESGPAPEAVLLDYSPRTINAAVATSVSTGSGATAATTMQNTSGSSHGQTNSFDAALAVGFFGDSLTGGVTLSEGRSSSRERSRSHSSGSESSSSSHREDGESMTVKDWACYSFLGMPNYKDVPASISPDVTTINWIWGQQYPWDVVQFRYSRSATIVNGLPEAGSLITLPNFVNNLLSDNTQLFPPSQLAQFGIDFTMKAVWRVKPQAAATTITLQHQIGYLTASHTLTGSVVQASFGTAVAFPPIITTPLNLCLYGLDPVGATSGSALAVVGFVPRQFLILPLPAALNGQTFVQPTAFSILSTSNNLWIEDSSIYDGLTSSDVNAGFAASPTALTATFTPNCTSLQMTLSFKVTEATGEYWLFMKHWKTGTSGVVVTITINGDTAGAITRYVDSGEAE